MLLSGKRTRSVKHNKDYNKDSGGVGLGLSQNECFSELYVQQSLQK